MASGMCRHECLGSFGLDRYPRSPLREESACVIEGLYLTDSLTGFTALEALHGALPAWTGWTQPRLSPLFFSPGSSWILPCGRTWKMPKLHLTKESAAGETPSSLPVGFVTAALNCRWSVLFLLSLT